MLAHFRRLVQPLSGRQPHGSLGVNTSLSRKTGLPHPTSRHCTRIAFSRCFSNQLYDLRLQAGSSLSPAYGRPGTSRCGLLLTRSYTRRTEPQELESTVETEAVPCSEDVEEGRNKKEKKRSKKNKTTTKASKKETTTKASKKKDVASSPVAKADLGIELNFPFEGTISKPEIETLPETPETHGKSVTSTSGGDAFTVHMADATDGSDARVYNICRDGEAVFYLPSVTTILSQTLPRQRGFMLSNWRRGLVKELGEGGYLQVRDQTRASGKRFHAALEAQLHRPHLFSIKTKDHPSHPPILTPHIHNHTHYSPIPPPHKYPPNHHNKSPTLLHTPSLADSDECSDSDSDSLVEEEEEEEKKAGVDEDGVTAVTDVGAGDAVTTSTDSSAATESSEEDSAGGYLRSVQHVLEEVSEVWALESVVAHLELGYSGTCDCIATYRGSLCLIDWKTSSRPRPLTSDLYDYPLQAVAYAGAVNQDPHYPFKVENVLIVVAYPSGEPGHAHFLSLPECQYQWSQWLSRLLHYQTLFASDLEDVWL